MPYVLRFVEVPEEAFIDPKDWSVKDYKKLSKLEKLGCLINDKYLSAYSTFAVIDSKKELFKIIKHCAELDLGKHFKEVEKKRAIQIAARDKCVKLIEEKGQEFCFKKLDKYYNIAHRTPPQYEYYLNKNFINKFNKLSLSASYTDFVNLLKILKGK